MRNAKCEIMNVPTDVLPHNYAFRIMNYEFISHLKCEKTFVFPLYLFFVGKIERLTKLP